MKDLKIFTTNIEDTAVNQINELLEQDAFKDSKIRIMPDVHAGKGCVIGFTGDLGDKVIPNVVGVDIGCGMLCVELGNIELDLEKLDKVIKKCIPSGMNVHQELSDIIPNFSYFINENNLKKLKCYKELKNKDNWLEKSMGTLGGGNHFIEVDEDENGNKYLVIHTGSRNLGKQVAEIYQNKAIEYCSFEKEMAKEIKYCIKTYKDQGRTSEINDKIKEIRIKYVGKTKLPKDLCYLEGQLREDYLHDMKICQEFAKTNRITIAKIIMINLLDYLNVVSWINANKEVEGFICFNKEDGLKADAFGGHLEYHNSYQCFETIHNYISFEDNIVRKGAISARKDERVLIPMNMRDGCIIGIGKGNDDWNQSAPHGAGRIMSRIKAKEVLTMDDYRDSMKDIFTSSVNEDTLDEAPMAYKPMQEIIDCIGDTIEIEKVIKPIYNFKASE